MLLKRRDLVRARRAREDTVRIRGGGDTHQPRADAKEAGEHAPVSLATGPPGPASLATGPPDPPGPAGGGTPKRRWSPARKRRVIVTLSLATAILVGVNVYAAVVIAGQRDGSSLPRPSGIPANISTGLANLMALSPLSGTAPGFTLTDQDGHTMSLSGLRGKVVVLEFMDPHCTDICPIVSQEFVDANRELGPLASKVVFAAVNVNQYVNSPQAMQGYSKAHQLGSIASWHFFTGPVPVLRKVWRDYHIQVQAPSRNADVQHTSAIYFINGSGTERYVTSPMVDHTSGGASYLPLAQIQSWSHGIAQLARDMAG
jgi:cytochrome oxidase Cu insertion factor (SCO1/SenC/PrrC family)